MNRSDRNERARNRIINRLHLVGWAGRAELARVADSNNYRRGAADLDRLHAEGVVEFSRGTSRGRGVHVPGKYRLAISTPEPASFWSTPEPIPADEEATLSVPTPSGGIATIPVPAQPFTWTPQVHIATDPDSPYTASPGNLTVRILPADPADFWA